MANPIHRTLRGLRNTRDLRAEMLSLAAGLVDNQRHGCLTVTAPTVAAATVRKEWDRLLPAIAPAIAARMSLEIEHSRRRSRDPDAVPLGRPSFRYEVLRLLIEADLRNESVSVKALIGLIGASQTPVRSALDGLRAAGLVEAKGTRLHLRPEEISMDMLARAGALPQTLRFRFEQGVQIKAPARLLERCLPLLEASPETDGWGRMALSGVATATGDVPDIDVAGLPRLDLVAQLPHKTRQFPAGLLRQLEDGLEPESRVLSAAPVSGHHRPRRTHAGPPPRRHDVRTQK